MGLFDWLKSKKASAPAANPWRVGERVLAKKPDSYFYPGLERWPGMFAYDPLYYDTMYSRWPERLPTQDMLSEALPEGAVQDGGSVSGFVYFQSVTSRESAVQFQMNLVDASDGTAFGVIAIPFQSAQG